jgi:hypothetical protein
MSAHGRLAVGVPAMMKNIEALIAEGGEITVGALAGFA